MDAGAICLAVSWSYVGKYSENSIVQSPLVRLYSVTRKAPALRSKPRKAGAYTYQSAAWAFTAPLLRLTVMSYWSMTSNLDQSSASPL